MKAREIHRRHFKSSVGSVLNEHYDSSAITPTALSSKNRLNHLTFPVSSSNLPGVKKLENKRPDGMPVSEFTISQPFPSCSSDPSRKSISNSDSIENISLCGPIENISLCGSRNPHTLYSNQSLEGEAQTYSASSEHMGSTQMCLTPQAEGDLLKRSASFSSNLHNLEDVQNKFILHGMPCGARSIVNETSRLKYVKHGNMNMRSSLESNRGASSINHLTSTCKKNPESSIKANNDRDLGAYIDWNKIFPHRSPSSTVQQLRSADCLSSKATFNGHTT